MSGWTNRGKYKALGRLYQGTPMPAVYYLVLVRDTVAPDEDTETLSELTQISGGTGYTTNGTSLSRNDTDFDVWTPNPTDDWALIQIRDVAWTANGGNLDSGAGARYAVLTDDNATPANREVLHFWDLSSNRNVSDQQALTLQNCEMRITE